MILISLFAFLVFLYSLFSKRLEKTVITAPILFSAAGMLIFFYKPVQEEIRTRLSKYTVIFMGWFGPRGLASILLGLVYLEQESNTAGDTIIRLTVMVIVLHSIFAHGLSTLPGINFYARKLLGLDEKAPEKQADSSK